MRGSEGVDASVVCCKLTSGTCSAMPAAHLLTVSRHLISLQGEIASLSCEPIGSSSGTIASSTQSRSRSGSTDPQQQLAGSSNEPGNSHDDPSSHSSHYSSSNVDATPKGSSSSSSRNDDQAPPSLVVSLFEVPSTPASVAAFLEREHEFRFLAVQPYDLSGKVAAPRMAVSGNGDWVGREGAGEGQALRSLVVGAGGDTWKTRCIYECMAAFTPLCCTVYKGVCLAPIF